MARPFSGPTPNDEVIDLCSEDEHPASPNIQVKNRVFLSLIDDDDDDSEPPASRRQANNGQRHNSSRLSGGALSRSKSGVSKQSMPLQSPLQKHSQGSPFSGKKRRSSNVSRSTSVSSNNRNVLKTKASGPGSASKPNPVEIEDSEEDRDTSKNNFGKRIRSKVSSSMPGKSSDDEEMPPLQKLPSKGGASWTGSVNRKQASKTKPMLDDDSDGDLPPLEKVIKQSASQSSTTKKNSISKSKNNLHNNSADQFGDDISPTNGRSRLSASQSDPSAVNTANSRSDRPESPAVSVSLRIPHSRLSQPQCTPGNDSSPSRQRRIVPKTVNEIKSWLEEYMVKLENEHSRNCIMALRRARTHALQARRTPKDEVSPFASMTSVQIKQGERLVAGVSTTKIASYAYRKKVNRTYKQLMTTPALGEVPRVPKYNHHTAVRGNVLEGDDDKLKYIPFFDDVDGCHDKVKEAAARKLERDLQEHHEQNVSASSRESERDLRSQYCLVALLQQLRGICDLQSITNHVLRRKSKESGLDKKQTAILLDILNTPNKLPQENEVAGNVCAAWESIFGFGLQYIVLKRDRITDILELKEEQVQEELVPSMPNPNQVIGTYTDMCCIICNTIHCQIHGGYHDKDNDNDESSMDLDEDKKSKFQYRQHIVMLYDETVQRHDRRVINCKGGLDNDSTLEVGPCSDLCHLNKDRMEEDFEWPEETIGILKALTVSRVPKAYEAKRSCYLAFALNRPCWQVHKEMQNISPREPQANIPIRSRLNAMEWKDNKKWYDNETKTLREKWWSQWTDAHDHQKRGHPEPCLHEGPCGKGCPCYEQNLLCEFYCDCTSSCTRKFTGCSCHSRGINCATETCICIQMNRECGPECSDCGAIERLDPSNKYNDKLFTTGCQNIVLQRGVGKKIFVGESMIENAGYGLYIGETAKKGDFIEEYVGEVITWSEVARRGIHNGLKETSYLFDLNNQGAIDADRQANKTRYINHGDDKDPARNCEAKILWVRGEHRIKFIASRPIKEGEELLFDYGEEFITKTGLDKKLPESKKSRTRKVLEDAVGAEKALDDIEGGGAIRAGRGGRGRKSRKIAKPARVKDLALDDEDPDPNFVASGNREVEEASEPVVSEEEDEEEEEEEDIISMVGKRKRIVPARYRK